MYSYGFCMGKCWTEIDDEVVLCFGFWVLEGDGRGGDGDGDGREEGDGGGGDGKGWDGKGLRFRARG